jgi:DNA-binding transcriptional MerR regulator
MRELYSTGQVARLLGIRQHHIGYAISSGHIPDAKLRFLGKRCFTDADMRRIARHFGVPVLKGASDVSV